MVSNVMLVARNLNEIEQKSALSEDVEAAIEILKNIAEEQEKDYCPNNANHLRKAAQYLETCRPRDTWKSSDEQKEQLHCITEQDKDNMIDKDFITLYNDLKKVK